MAIKKVLCCVLQISTFLALAGVLAVAIMLVKQEDVKNDSASGSSLNEPDSAESVSTIK